MSRCKQPAVRSPRRLAPGAGLDGAPAGAGRRNARWAVLGVGLRLFLLALSGLGWLLAGAAPAAAHAEVLVANPRPGIGVPQPPGTVVLKFSEPLQPRLSRIQILDSSGDDVGEGATMAVPGDDAAMQRKLGFMRPGEYRVRWTTVSRIDNHTLKGVYTFGVGRATEGAEGIADSPLDSEGLLGLVGRFVGLGGLSLWAGMAVLGGVSLRAGVSPATLARLGRWAPIATLAGMGLAALSAAVVASGSLTGLSSFLLDTRSGQLRLVLLAAAATAATVPWSRRLLRGALAGLAVFAEAASGHAAGAPIPGLATASFALHLFAVGVWLFAITASVLAGRGVLAALRAFSPAAVAAAGAVGLTGVTNSLFELRHLGDLVSSGYGAAVLGKVAAFAAMVAFGLIHQRRRSHPDPTTNRLILPLRDELAGGIVALLVATALVGFPNPPREAAAAKRGVGPDPVLADLARRDALSLAGASGPFVVGLTILPPRPGPIETRVHVIGVSAGDGLRAAHVRATSPTGSLDLPLAPCGLGCFAGRGDLPGPGTWRFDVGLASNRGPVEVTTTAALPSPDGHAELERALQSMERLRSAQLEESLSGSQGGPVIRSDYAFSAPDAMRFHISTGADVVFIAGRSFNRSGPSAPWQASPAASPFRWPQDYFRSFWATPAAVRILGEADIDGARSRIIGFVRPDLPAWFRLWVGVDDGRVRRMEMRTGGHLMDHSYRGFDQPIEIPPPL